MATHRCDSCEDEGPSTAFCTACNFSLCDDCWSMFPPHKKGLLGPHGLPHEKANPIIVQELKICMDEPNDDNELQLHQEDEETTWFGLERDDGGTPVLAEYRRYAAVMMQTSGQSEQQQRYPSLVSFIGQTGAGKSSLIKLLIDLKAESAPHNDTTARSSPVIGRSASAVPTSADVHLYLSPETVSSTQPILYADCEGFNGGEQNPVAVNAVISENASLDQNTSKKKASRSTAIQKVSQGTKRLLKWASRDSLAYEETSKRGYTVSEMYPRIFYAFSDVIVFVSDNPKTLEVVVERMLEWADANYSQSINQPIKPHAVIVLNKSNTKTPEDQWDHINATAHLLNTTTAKIDDNRTFAKYTAMWKKRSTSRIDSMQDLLRCYYSTVHVVRMPEKSRYQLLNQQRQQLHDVITECCAMSFKDKQERELLTDTDEFGLYLSLAFDHFSETLDEPFNFVEASLKRRPVSTSLADILLTFAVYFANFKKLQGRILELFNGLTQFVASCILLESARSQRIGRPEDWFGELIAENDIQGRLYQSNSSVSLNPKPGSYRDMCRRAIFSYFNSWVPCGHSIDKRRCELRRKYHGQSHSAKSTWRGTIFASGSFETKVHVNDLLIWEDQVLSHTIAMHDKLKHTNAATFRASVVQAHRALLPDLYQTTQVRSQMFQLNSLCVSCLFGPAQHELGCGHIVCSQCARDFGTLNDCAIIINGCPLHDDESTLARVSTIQMSPAHSGLRVLTLDGGGIRGIVELSVLKALQNCMGIELQDCFDLVVGTSTGGIIALGFGHQGWNIDQCIQKFRELVYPVFTKRSMQYVHVLRRMQLLVKHSRYETAPIENALKDAFSPNAPLFPANIVDHWRLKTAVVATSGSGSNAWIFSNYATSRGRDESGPKYLRYRPNIPKNELRTWEAARATSAAPGFFKPFSLDRENLRAEEWIDGGLLHNNPVEVALEEARRIAETETLNPQPDIILSVGTGLTKHRKKFGEIVEDAVDDVTQPKMSWLRNLFTIVSYQIKLNLDTDRKWDRVVESDRELAKRMYRINPDLGMDPPELDDVGAVPMLARAVPGLLAKDLVIDQKIRQVSASLMGLLFYFEREGSPTSITSSSTELQGWIRCRLSNEKHPKAAEFLSLSARPEFIIHNSHLDGDDIHIPVPISQLQAKDFQGVRVKLTISGDDVSTTMALRLPGVCAGKSEFPISGFPRRLLKLDFGLG